MISILSVFTRGFQDSKDILMKKYTTIFEILYPYHLTPSILARIIGKILNKNTKYHQIKSILEAA
jgi:hypothetical protein